MRLTNLLRTTASAAVVGAVAFGFAGAASAQEGPQDRASSVDDINGVVRFDSRAVRLDDVAPTMGGGQVQFGGERVTINSGRINWFGRDVDWADKVGFRGKDDVESPFGRSPGSSADV